MSPDTHNLGSGEPRHTDLNKRGVQKSSKSIEDDIYDFSNSASSYWIEQLTHSEPYEVNN